MAGQVIHVVHSNDIWKMGGLRKLMPFTYVSTLIGCLAIGGIPPLAGFFSKDEIILASLQSGHYLTAGVGLAVGCLTAFYMFRLFFTVFHGKPRSDYHHVHEDKFMTSPIVILAIPSLLAGWLFKDAFASYVLPAMEPGAAHLGHPGWLPIVASLLGVTGVVGGWLFYGRDSELPGTVRKSLGGFYTLVQNKFYIDEVYLAVTHRFVFACIAAPIKWFDRNIVDGLMNLVAKILEISGMVQRAMQTGQVQFYLSVTILGLFLIFFLGSCV